MVFVYPAIVHFANNSLWLEFPNLVGCTTFGDNIEEVYDNAMEAMEVYILSSLENNISLPNATDFKELKSNIDDNSFITYIKKDIDLSKNTKSVKKTLTIPAWLNNLALEKNINFSKELQEALVDKLLKED
ncbi:type II toxin-antitoxin system HicB family antitoxin [Megamonas funiformis]|jgi:predicted RNase H-like HicB family nuclease|uniref:type II toxin-antitoxin system HicB family antitoxin n=1 Tax=Megamonas funiformis TaxID=437897 RepID=UPI00266FE750|nr:type II toxin-antitoxin system HicB family antitoxin [Megamonas funiformis]